MGQWTYPFKRSLSGGISFAADKYKRSDIGATSLCRGRGENHAAAGSSERDHGIIQEWTA